MSNNLLTRIKRKLNILYFFNKWLKCGDIDADRLSEFLKIYQFACKSGLEGYKTDGVDIFRYAEYSLAFKMLLPLRGGYILDIGSGYSLFPGMLAVMGKAKVFASDIDTEALKRCEILFKNLKVSSSQFAIGEQDVRKLGFDEGSFERVSAISCLEHIPDNGDRTGMLEIKRVLKHQGIAVVSVPVNPAGLSIETGGPHQFEKRYDEKELQKSLLSIEGLKPVDKVFINLNISDTFSQMWYENHFYHQLGKYSAFISLGILSFSHQISENSRGVVIKFVANK